MFSLRRKVKAGLYNHVLTRPISPGAEAIAFEVNTDLPILRPIGNGTMSGSLRVLQPPQVYFNPQVQIAGIGIQVGQFISAPLQGAE